MSIFTKPISQLGTSDVEELLQDSAVESVRLEFKSEVPDKDETLKKLSSFANTFGGFVVIGAKANSKDGRIESLPGVVAQAGFKQKVIQWCFDSTSPPLVVEVSEAISAPTPGSVCYVIYTAESELAPHFINGRKGVWVRTDEFSQHYRPQLATENEIRHLLDRRRLIRERRTEVLQRSRQRFERYRSRSRSAQGPLAAQVQQEAARLEFSIGPRFPARPVCGQAAVAAALRDTRIAWRQTSYPYPTSILISQHESVLLFVPKDIRSGAGLAEANVWGMLFYGLELEIEIASSEQDAPIRGIHLYRLVGYLLVISEHAKQMLSRTGYEGPLSIEIKLSEILGIPWFYSQDNVVYEGPVSELDDEFSFALETTTEMLRQDRDGLVISMLRYILFGMNWADYASDTDQLERLVLSGYKYNFWTTPTRLQIAGREL